MENVNTVATLTAERDALRETLARIVNLANHPMFPATSDVPAFWRQIESARALLATIHG